MRRSSLFLLAIGVLAGSSAAGAVVTVQYPNARYTLCAGINESGMVAGTYQASDFTSHGFLETSAGVFQSIDISFGSQAYAQASGINDAGTVVGYDRAQNPFGAWLTYGYVRRATEQVVPVSWNGVWNNTEVHGINNSGSVVGITYGSDPANPSSFLWDGVASSPTWLSPAGLTGVVVNAISNSGLLVGSYGGGSGGWLRDATGRYTTFQIPGASNMSAQGINSVGVVVGWYDDAAGQHGFVRDLLGQILTVDLASALTTELRGINDNGYVAGSFTDANGQIRGFTNGVSELAPSADVQDLTTPEPATWMGAVLALLIALVGQRLGGRPRRVSSSV